MSSINRDELNEKQRIELAAVESFLILYNQRRVAVYEPVKVGDTPDVECLDKTSGEVLDIEVTLLDDRPDDIPYLLGRASIKDELSLSRVIDFKNDVIPRLKERLKDKLLSRYGDRAALLIRQVGPLWTSNDWKREAPSIISEVLNGCESHYGQGIWILCSNTSNTPISFDLFPLFDPEVGVIEWDPIIEPDERIVGIVTYERNITPDFTEFIEREDVDPPTRIDSPHDCEYAILIAFVSGESEYWRKEAIEFYRSQLVFFCPCGQGSARLIGNWFATKT